MYFLEGGYKKQLKIVSRIVIAGKEGNNNDDAESRSNVHTKIFSDYGAAGSKAGIMTKIRLTSSSMTDLYCCLNSSIC